VAQAGPCSVRLHLPGTRPGDTLDLYVFRNVVIEGISSSQKSGISFEVGGLTDRGWVAGRGTKQTCAGLVSEGWRVAAVQRKHALGDGCWALGHNADTAGAHNPDQAPATMLLEHKLIFVTRPGGACIWGCRSALRRCHS
jgi:hypothetical protein